MMVAGTRLLTVEVARLVRFRIYFKAQLAGFADGSDVGCELKSEVKNDSKVFGRSGWNDGVARY
jgi:hypothetical protein